MPDESKKEEAGERLLIGAQHGNMIFCDRAFIELPDSYEFLKLTLASNGYVAGIYSFTPEHAKRLLLLLEKVIKNYEKEKGSIEASLPLEPDKS